MSKRIFFIICFLITLGFSQEYKAVANPQEVQNKIINANKEINTLSASFTQEKHMSILNKPFISTGVFYLKNPSKVRWEYKNPFSYIVVLVDNKVIIKDGDDLQNYDMSKNAVFKEINNTMSGLVNGKMLEDRNFSSQIFENNESYKVVLKPKNENIRGFVEEINIIFDKNSLETKQVIMKEKSGDKTLIHFTNTKINQNISDSMFTTI